MKDDYIHFNPLIDGNDRLVNKKLLTRNEKEHIVRGHLFREIYEDFEVEINGIKKVQKEWTTIKLA